MPSLKVLICIPEDLKNTLSEKGPLTVIKQVLSDLLVPHPQYRQGIFDIRGFSVI